MCLCFCVEFINLLSIHGYSGDIFSLSGTSRILNSDRKQNTT